LAECFYQHTFANGLTLLGEKMPFVQSAALTLMLPAGSATDPAHGSGSATVLADLVTRGAGSRDNRQLTEYLDSLGLQRGCSVGVYHLRFSCAAIAAKVIESISTISDIVRRPQLPEAGFEAAKDLALQALAGLEDDPRQKLTISLREIFLPQPLGRNPMGNIRDLKKMSLKECKSDWENRFQPKDAILAIAGNIDFEQVKAEVEKYFGDFTGSGLPKIELIPQTQRYHFEKQKSEQTHIGIAYPSVPETHKDYYKVRIASEVLGGGMSGRLFTEIREKRALCYSIWAGYTSLKDNGAILAYAGTSNERAQATLDCMIEQINLMGEGIMQNELDRAKVGLKAATIMAGESTGARAGAIAHDFFMRGRIRTLDEIKKEIDGITVEQVNDCLKKMPAGPFTIVLVGPKELKVH
jgi:predicted Zn-dependent peptidase